MLRDISQIDVPPAERLVRALPFRGTLYAAWHPQLPAVRAGTAGSRSGGCSARRLRARRTDEAERLHPLPARHAAKRGEAERARAAFERSIALQPDLAEANNDLGTLVAQSGRLDAAIEHFQKALASMPDYPDALNNLGYALLLTGRDEARTLYERRWRCSRTFRKR